MISIHPLDTTSLESKRPSYPRPFQVKDAGQPGPAQSNASFMYRRLVVPAQRKKADEAGAGPVDRGSRRRPVMRNREPLP